MSTLTVDIFVSVDGWAGSDGLPGYFGYLGPELEQWIREEGGAPQTLLLGRKTYEIWAGAWGVWDENAEGLLGELTKRYNRVPKYVASRTFTELGW